MSITNIHKRSGPAPIGTGPSQTALFRFMTPGRNYAFRFSLDFRNKIDNPGFRRVLT